MSFSANAQETKQEEPIKYRMQLVYVFDENSSEVEHIFVIGQSGFKTVDALKKFIGRLPAGSILEWAPGCKRMGGEPLLSSEEDMEEFKAFCEEKKIKFVLIPSG
jgi:hypothetical protein